jgi:phage shock protein A
MRAIEPPLTSKEITMRLFRRISDIITANLNELVDQFEDPERMLKQAFREMEQALTSALQSAARSVAQERLLDRQAAQHRDHAQRWRERAAQAVAAGDDQLARRAITVRRHKEQLFAALNDQLFQVRDTNARLHRQIDGMRAKMGEVRWRLDALVARRRTAEARRRLSCIDGSMAVASYDVAHWLTRVELAEDEADALAELSGEDEAAQMLQDVESAAVEQELAELKRHAGV